MLYDGDGRKTQKYTKTKRRKNSPIGCPPIPPFTKCRPTVFRCPKTPIRSQTSPNWERVPNLMGQKKRQGWVRYGQLIAENITFVHIKFQDLQQERTRVRIEVQK